MKGLEKVEEKVEKVVKKGEEKVLKEEVEEEEEKVLKVEEKKVVKEDQKAGKEVEKDREVVAVLMIVHSLGQECTEGCCVYCLYAQCVGDSVYHSPAF